MVWRAFRRIVVTLALVAALGLLLWNVYLHDLQPDKRGIHLLLDDGRNAWPVARWYDHLWYARQLVGEWGYVVELIRADDLDVARWQYFMNICADLHLRPILRLATSYDRENGWWRAPDADADGSYSTLAAQYAAFVAALQWPIDRHYVIVGNEPNHGGEWSGRPDAAAYARFLIDTASALHSADPYALVLNAGFDPYTPHTGSQPFADGMYYMDEESFLDGMIAAYPAVFASIDLWASHVYPQGLFTAPPWVQSYGRDLLNDATNPAHVAPPPGIVNRGINGYVWELWKLGTYGIVDLPVMITETGWRHTESTDVNALDDAPLPLPDAVTVADYIDLAFYGNAGRYPQYPESGWTPWSADARVIAVTPFALNGLPAEWGHGNWLALDAHGAVLDTYAVFDRLAQSAP
ncbi:MAG: hypothetical protein HXY40_05720 [Chloroflexi bacterium]|nr:hypothetical protein [Chloroflexota bacterium]